MLMRIALKDLYDQLMQQQQNGYMKALTSADGYGELYKFKVKGKGDGNSSQGLGSYGYNYNRNVIHDSFKEVDVNISVNSKMDLIDNGEDQAEKQQRANKIVVDATVRVDMSSSGIGSEPGLMETMARKLLNSEINWKRLLKKYLIAASSRDRHLVDLIKDVLSNAIYLDKYRRGKRSKRGKVCIDTSGSISDEDLGNFMGQVAVM